MSPNGTSSVKQVFKHRWEGQLHYERRRGYSFLPLPEESSVHLPWAKGLTLQMIGNGAGDPEGILCVYKKVAF